MTSSPAPSETRVDGRAARGERTRNSIIDALHSLLREGASDVGARVVAERAGVSMRSVFQHFSDMESVYLELAARQSEVIRPHLEAFDTSLPLPERVERIVIARDEMFATIAPVRSAVNRHRSARTSPSIRANLLRLHRAQREQVQSTFQNEIGDNERLLLQVDVWLSFETWEQFTSQHGLSRAATRGHLQSLMQSVLAR